MNCLLLIMFLLGNSAQSGKEIDTIDKNYFEIDEEIKKNLEQNNQKRKLYFKYYYYLYDDKDLNISTLKDIFDDVELGIILEKEMKKDNSISKFYHYINSDSIKESILIQESILKENFILDLKNKVKFYCIDMIISNSMLYTLSMFSAITEEDKLNNIAFSNFKKEVEKNILYLKEKNYPIKILFINELKNISNNLSAFISDNSSDTAKQLLSEYDELAKCKKLKIILDDKKLEDWNQWEDFYKKESFKRSECFKSSKKKFRKTLRAIHNFEDFKKFDSIQGI